MTVNDAINRLKELINEGCCMYAFSYQIGEVLINNINQLDNCLLCDNIQYIPVKELECEDKRNIEYVLQNNNDSLINYNFILKLVYPQDPECIDLLILGW